MTHRHAPLTPEGRRRLIERCRTRPVAHVAAEMGISRATASKWVNRYHRYGEFGLLDRSSAPHRLRPALLPPLDQGHHLRQCPKGFMARLSVSVSSVG
jgi:transposase-like protein